MQGASGRALRSDAALDFGGWSSGDFARDMRLRAQPHFMASHMHRIPHRETFRDMRWHKARAYSSSRITHNNTQCTRQPVPKLCGCCRAPTPCSAS